jgi:isopentenyl diphosphate isomerase/L-lactate dehydrogenase-like FMN-dependent dehydrogenase
MGGVDAALAVAAGCEGIVVSNPGGRQLTLALVGVRDCASLDKSVLRRRRQSGWERV